MRLVAADAALRERIYDDTFPIWGEGLSRGAYGRWNEAQLRTAWGRDRLQRLALVREDGAYVASLKRYRFEARLDGAAVPVVGIGAVFTPAGRRGEGYAARLIEETLETEARAGATLAVLFSEIGDEYYRRVGFSPVPLEELALGVVQQNGAPAMLVRSGTDADLANLAAMHQVRAAASRFALVRSPDLIAFGIARRRLLAGLGAPGARQAEFFVAEEGAAAVAYVVITADRRGWTIEEAGDRDPAGARLGAMLQVLIAREPSHVPPPIRALWPASFPIPPQIRVASRDQAAELLMVRPLLGNVPPLAPADVFYWHADVF